MQNTVYRRVKYSKINEILLTALLESKHLVKTTTVDSDGNRLPYAVKMYEVTSNGILYYRNTRIIKIDNKKKKVFLGTHTGDYQTETTKNKINMVAQEFGLPELHRKGDEWIWDDGIKYTKSRAFKF
jgi:hypothetical protein